MAQIGPHKTVSVVPNGDVEEGASEPPPKPVMRRTSTTKSIGKDVGAWDAPDAAKTTLWDTLNPDTDKHEAEAAGSHEAIREDDQIRLNLLRISRETSPVGTILRVDMLRRSVLPKLASQPTQWVILFVYGATAFLTRMGYFDPGDMQDSSGSFANAGTSARARRVPPPSRRPARGFL